MRRIKNWMELESRSLLLMCAVIGFVGTEPSVAQAGAYSVFFINMAQLNYKTPVPYSKIIKSGSAKDVFKSWGECESSIKARVANNKRYGNDFEAFLIIYTDRYPTGPTGANVSGTCTLAHVNSGTYGKWEGWSIYWVPARNRGYFYNPYNKFKAYGASVAAAKTAPIVLLALPASPTKAPVPAPTLGLGSDGRSVFMAVVGSQIFLQTRIVSTTRHGIDVRTVVSPGFLSKQPSLLPIVAACLERSQRYAGIGHLSDCS